MRRNSCGVPRGTIPRGGAHAEGRNLDEVCFHRQTDKLTRERERERGKAEREERAARCMNSGWRKFGSCTLACAPHCYTWISRCISTVTIFVGSRCEFATRTIGSSRRVRRVVATGVHEARSRTGFPFSSWSLFSFPVSRLKYRVSDFSNFCHVYFLYIVAKDFCNWPPRGNISRRFALVQVLHNATLSHIGNICRINCSIRESNCIRVTVRLNSILVYTGIFVWRAWLVLSLSPRFSDILRYLFTLLYWRNWTTEGATGGSANVRFGLRVNISSTWECSFYFARAPLAFAWCRDMISALSITVQSVLWCNAANCCAAAKKLHGRCARNNPRVTIREMNWSTRARR